MARHRARHRASSLHSSTSPLNKVDAQSRVGWQAYVKTLGIDDLSDLTPSQKDYIENLRAIEAANPKAKPDEIAMAISLLLWEGRIWDRDGKAASVTSVAGVPLVLDYKGGRATRTSR